MIIQAWKSCFLTDWRRLTTGHQEKPTEQRSAGCAMTKSKSFGKHTLHQGGIKVSEIMFSFSKWVSKWAFIFKMWKVLWVLFFLFPKKHNYKQKSEHSHRLALLIRLWTNNEIYIKLLNSSRLSSIYNLLYKEYNSRHLFELCIF